MCAVCKKTAGKLKIVLPSITENILLYKKTSNFACIRFLGLICKLARIKSKNLLEVKTEGIMSVICVIDDY